MESEQTLIMMGQSLHQPPLPLHTTGGGGAVITHNTIVMRQTLLMEIGLPTSFCQTKISFGYSFIGQLRHFGNSLGKICT